MDLMEPILSRENLLAALHKVEANKGAGGIDGASTRQLRAYVVQHWDKRKQQLLKGTYKPSPVRRVEIPKPDGGVRLLGIPPVMDRFIQPAILQVLTPIFDPTFSPHSYDFAPTDGDTMRFGRRRSISGKDTAMWSTSTWRNSSTGSTMTS